MLVSVNAAVSDEKLDAFIEHWRKTGGSELANTQSLNALCLLIGVAAPNGSLADDAANDYVFERRVFQDNGDGTRDFGRIDAYKRGCFILEAKQGSDADRRAAERGDDDLDLFGQTATARWLIKQPGWYAYVAWARPMVLAVAVAPLCHAAKFVCMDNGARVYVRPRCKLDDCASVFPMCDTAWLWLRARRTLDYPDRKSVV